MHWAPATTRQFSSALLSFWAGYGDGARCSVFCAQCWVFSSQALHLPHSRITFALSCRALIIIKSNQPDSYFPAPTLAIHPWQFHKRHREALAAQPTASRQQMGARCNWYESEGREAVGGLLIRTASQTKLAATPPKSSVLRSPAKLTAKCEVNIAPSWRVPPAACYLLLAATLKGNLR